MTSMAQYPDDVLHQQTVWQQVCAEWHGDGLLMKQGAWSEIAACLFATLPVGLVLLLSPTASVHSHTFNLAMWYYPNWAIATELLASAALTATGVALYFFRGRCVASRLCRLFGGGIGCTIWVSLYLLDALAFGFTDATTFVYLLPTMLYVRTVSLAWRRWFR